jgi:hypothetical protein
MTMDFFSKKKELVESIFLYHNRHVGIRFRLFDDSNEKQLLKGLYWQMESLYVIKAIEKISDLQIGKK